MSHSIKKTPISGITTAKSEKKDKRLYNRRFRRVVKIAVNKEAEVLPILKEHSNPWSMDKDGKVWVDTVKYPEVVRK